MFRVALYARYSSDNQREASIQDQLRICRERAEKEHWLVSGVYEDARISGASVVLRPGIQALMQDAGFGRFDIVLTEALDRISRDQADIATLYKHLKFLGVPIITLSEGEINELHVGLKGTMNALFLKDLAAKTHRGMKGRAENGKAAAGLSYGYDAVRSLDAKGEPNTGERTINAAQAEIVRRIFNDFVAGRTPAEIVRQLNAEKIPGPQGQAWLHTSIRGHNERGTGIINNELYVGRQIWNRMRYLKDPSTGRRVSRMNPKEEWIVSDVPHLRIIDQHVWDAAKKRQVGIREKSAPQRDGLKGRMAPTLCHLRKPKWLLSGLLVCGACGGSYTMRGKDKYGCSNRMIGTCTNGRTVRQSTLEEGVVAGLRDRMLSPEVAEVAMKGFIEEVNRQNREKRANERSWQSELSKVEKAIASLICTIEAGMRYDDMFVCMADLQARKADLQHRLGAEGNIEPEILPTLAGVYRKKCGFRDDRATRSEMMPPVI
ncbi:MAG: recombinase family protein, partial [Asticcacaulis sp.]|uniref:recombinase family protein n=1 Tax=Asticcacaulis sp. TaxID=1872648 RepID=UPI0039E39D98